MIELLIKDWLSKKIIEPVFLEFPEKAPKSFVLLEKIGSGRNNQLDNSTFAFQSYANSLYEAALLNEKVKIEILNSVLLDKISKVQLNSDYNFTDTTTKNYRYQAVFDIFHY